MKRPVAALVLCLLVTLAASKRDISLPSIANHLINAASGIQSNTEDVHVARRTFLNSIIHAAAPGSHQVRAPRDDALRTEAFRETRDRTVRAVAAVSSCGIGYRPNGTANVCVNNDCTISKMACDALQVDPVSYDGDISSCTVLEVTCGTFVADLLSDNCSPVLMFCDSGLVSATPPANATCAVNTLLCQTPSPYLIDYTPSTTAKCTVDQLVCDGNVTATPYTDTDNSCLVDRSRCSGSDEFTEIISECFGDGSCRFSSVRNPTLSVFERHGYPAEDPCFIPDPNVPCNCPLDRMGDSCQTGRPFSCSFVLQSPKPECQQLPYPQSLLDGDPPCFTKWTRNDEIPWTYIMACAFLDTTGLSDYQENSNFPYFVRNGLTFAISAPKGVNPRVSARLKVFNFNVLSDNNASIIVPITAANLLGSDSVVFTLQLSNVSDRYYAGGRLYFEAGITTAVAGIRKRFDRRFIDPPDAPRIARSDGGLSGGTIAGIVIGCLAGAALIGGGVYLYIRKKKHDAKRLKKVAKQ